MDTRVTLVWKNGFPSETVVVADQAYRLTIQKFELEARTYFGTIALVFVADGEYFAWREECSEENFLLPFRSLQGAVDWRKEGILVLAFPVDSSLSRERQAEVLLQRYVAFLGAAGIELTQELTPQVEWQEC